MKILSNATNLGLLSILFWSTNIAFSRTIAESLGPVTTAAYIYLLSGGLGCLYLMGTGRLKGVRELPAFYLLVCGGCFIINMVTFYLAIGFASGRQQVLEVGLINYLWPSLTLVFSVPILKKRARWFLVPGILLALAGISMATLQQESFSWAVFRENCSANFLPYLMALIAAVSWGLYSCFSRAMGGHIESGAVPLFLLTAGVLLLVAKCFRAETSVWTTRAAMELLYVSVFPTFLAYTFWDASMRRGNVVLLAALSYFIPLLSTIISAIHLAVPMGWNLWTACGIVILGAVVCKLSIEEPRQHSIRMKDEG
jgi:drug/metabolite transporter (DMT)-like permease